MSVNTVNNFKQSQRYSVETNNLKLFTCPKCQRYYDYQLRGNIFVGRVPLILSCEHTICEDCVRHTFMKKEIVCGECHTTTPIADSDIKKKYQEVFPVNYYLLGLLCHNKPPIQQWQHNQVGNYYQMSNTYQTANPYQVTQAYQMTNVSFKPAMNRKFLQDNMNSLSISSSTSTTMECSRYNCQQVAQVHCSDCDEVFCEVCSDDLHKSARGLKKHKINSLNLLYYPELKIPCVIHKPLLIEFYCYTCKIDLCCYCIVQDHKNHDYLQLTHLKESEVPEFKSLINKAEDMVRRLIVTDKKVDVHLNANTTSLTNNSVDQQISRCFENLHATLQILEKQLRNDANICKDINYLKLRSIKNEVGSNLYTLNQLIQSAREVIEGKQTHKLNVKVIKEQLENALAFPTYLLTEKNSAQAIEFFCGNLLNDLKDNFYIKSDKKCSYSLVTAEQLPPDYEVEELSETGSSSLLSIGVASKTGSCLESNALEKWNVHAKPFNKKSIESWLQNTKETKEQKTEVVDMTTLKKGDRQKVIVSHINSPECFYVQIRSMAGALNKLSKNIDTYMKYCPPSVNKPEPGTLYIIKYTTISNMQWCRGMIVEKANDKGLYTAFFIDYGNIAKNINTQDIKVISEDLALPTPFAFECKLFNLYPIGNKWDPNVMNIMARIISSSGLIMIIMDIIKSVLEVDIVTIDGDTSIRDALKFMGYGMPYLKTPTDLDIFEEEPKSISNVKLQKHIAYYKKGDSVLVTIKYVIDPFNIYVSLSQFRERFDELHESMQAFYTLNKKGYIYTPRKDMVVAVLYNDKWYRGIITEKTEGRGLVGAYLVDTGNTVLVSWHHVRKLIESFISLEYQAILVKLADIKPADGMENWPQNSIDYFEKFIHMQTPLKMTINENSDPTEIVLFECFPSMNLCINAILVKEQLAESTGTLSTTIEWPEYTSDIQQDVPQSFTLQMMKTVQSSSQGCLDLVKDSDEEELENVVRKPVEIISAENPALVYVRFIDKKEEQHAFNLRLQDYYTNRTLTKRNWKQGDICIVLNERKYFRAIILEVLMNKDFMVLLKDIALEIVVHESNIGVLEDEFKSFHEFAIRCHLAGISPTGGTSKWPAIACDFLQEIFKTKQNFLLAKTGIVNKQKKSLPVTIWYTEFIPGGPLESSKTILHSVNKLLINNGLVLKAAVEKYEPPTAQKESMKEKSPECPETNISPESKLDWNDLVEMEQNEEETKSHKLKGWLPPLAFKEDNFIGTPTFVNNEAEIYIHETKLDTLLTNMEMAMKEHFIDTSPEPIIWTVGQQCTVKYFVNNNWYRGKIIANNENSLKVIMVDYGNEEDCEPTDLRESLMFEDVPVFANKIKLDNVYPKDGKWQTSDLDRLHAKIVDNNVSVILTEIPVQGQATAALIYHGSTNVNEFMLKSSPNLCERRYIQDNDQTMLQNTNYSSSNNKFNVVTTQNMNMANDSASDSDVIIENEYIVSPDEDLTDDLIDDLIDDTTNLTYLQSDLPNIPEGEKLKVAIINFVSYNRVIFEIADSENFDRHKKMFETISNEIKEQAAEQPVLTKLEVGLPCIAKFSDDGEWYRAQIFDVTEDLVNVWFVDFGNFEDLPLDLIRKTKPKWLNVPIEHYLAEISNIQLVNEASLESVLESFSTYYNTIKHIEIMSKDPLCVQIYESDSDELSYKKLLDDGFLCII